MNYTHSPEEYSGSVFQDWTDNWLEFCLARNILFLGQWDGSADKQFAVKPYDISLTSWALMVEEATLVRCLLTTTYAPWHMCNTHTHNNKSFIKRITLFVCKSGLIITSETFLSLLPPIFYCLCDLGMK